MNANIYRDFNIELFKRSREIRIMRPLYPLLAHVSHSRNYEQYKFPFVDFDFAIE